MKGSVQPNADPQVSPDRDWLGMFAVVHCAVNQVAFYGTCRHMCKLTTLKHCRAQSSPWLTQQCLHLFPAN